MTPEELIEFMSSRADIEKEKAKEALEAFVLSQTPKKFLVSREKLTSMYFDFFKEKDRDFYGKRNLRYFI